MSQTNAANAATRLHPVEFGGTSSIAFAAYMIPNVKTTEDVCSDCNAKSEYCKLQEM